MGSKEKSKKRQKALKKKRNILHNNIGRKRMAEQPKKTERQLELEQFAREFMVEATKHHITIGEMIDPKGGLLKYIEANYSQPLNHAYQSVPHFGIADPNYQPVPEAPKEEPKEEKKDEQEQVNESVMKENEEAKKEEAKDEGSTSA